MRLIFMGSPDFAVPALTSLLAAGHDVAAVYTQPPRPAGRGQALRRQPVHEAADAAGLTVRTPLRLRQNDEEQDFFAALNADVAVVAAYGLLLPKAMLDATRLGCLNVHASLLPRWRGASPIQSAILAGDAQSGVSIMRMEEGLDTGPVLLSEATPLSPHDTAAELHDRLAEIGSRLIVRALAERPEPVVQPAEGVTYAKRLTRADGRIDWRRPAAELDRQIRAMTPWPGAFTTIGGQTVRIGAATPVPAPSGGAALAAPGTVLDDVLTVSCGEGALRITRIQKPGRAMMAAEAFLRGASLAKGSCFE